MNKEKLQEMFLKMAFSDEKEQKKEKELRFDDHIMSKSHGVKIVILQRGWVVVGELYYRDCGRFIEGILERAKVIRTWGTTKGLGEIASNGPISNKTILDECGTVRFSLGCEVAMIDCVEEKWQL